MKTSKAGFNLLDLLVLIACVSCLTGIFLPGPAKIQATSQTGAYAADPEQIQGAEVIWIWTWVEFQTKTIGDKPTYYATKLAPL